MTKSFIDQVWGNSIDWVYDNTNAKVAFALELRPSAAQYKIGFMLPTTQIRLALLEAWAGVKAVLDHI